MPDPIIKKFDSEDAYHASQRSSSIDTRLWPVYQDRSRKDVEAFMPWWIPGAEVLDAGCGDGYTMDIMRDHGFMPRGSDLTPSKAKTAREFDHVVEVCDLSDMPWPSGVFDIVYCRHVFEHVIKPKRTLLEFRRVLAPHGRLCMIVPIVVSGEVRGKHPQEIPDKEYVDDLVLGAGFSIARSSLEKRPYGNEVWIWGEKP